MHPKLWNNWKVPQSLLVSESFANHMTVYFYHQVQCQPHKNFCGPNADHHLVGIAHLLLLYWHHTQVPVPDGYSTAALILSKLGILPVPSTYQWFVTNNYNFWCLCFECISTLHIEWTQASLHSNCLPLNFLSIFSLCTKFWGLRLKQIILGLQMATVTKRK